MESRSGQIGCDKLIFFLCNCEKFYFCLNGHTTGMDHKRKRKIVTEHKCGIRVKSEASTDIRVSLSKTSSYCKMCHWKHDGILSKKCRRVFCKTSTMRCGQFQEPICNSCWKEGYDKHNEQV